MDVEEPAVHRPLPGLLQRKSVDVAQQSERQVAVVLVPVVELRVRRGKRGNEDGDGGGEGAAAKINAAEEDVVEVGEALERLFALEQTGGNGIRSKSHNCWKEKEGPPAMARSLVASREITKR